jgi:hypothetical protein
MQPIILPGFSCTKCRDAAESGRYILDREYDKDQDGKVILVRYYITLTCDKCYGQGPQGQDQT